MKICFVCLGNIVRSPLAENMFAHLAEKEGVGDKYEVDSAGTSAYHVGEAPDSRMRQVAAEKGLEYTGRARQFQRRTWPPVPGKQRKSVCCGNLTPRVTLPMGFLTLITAAWKAFNVCSGLWSALHRGCWRLWSVERRNNHDIDAWCVQNGHGSIRDRQSVGGGCINQGAVITTEKGRSFFVKTNRSAPPELFPREAEGLQALDVEEGPRVPDVFHAEEHFIILEYLDPSPKSEKYWTVFGKQLAHLHHHTHHQFGFHHDNYIGSTPQINTWEEDGFEFFARHRLLYQAALGRDKGRLTSGDVQKVETVARRLSELVPPQESSLIHGDLWTGNAITDHQGDPAIIDPAAHYGWGEAELAMTTLFGSFPDRFYRAYEDHRDLERGYRERFPVYNLYHLLNHVNLFGGSYLSQVRRVLSKYA